MNVLLSVVFYTLAAALCCGMAIRALVDLSDIPDSFTKKDRGRRGRPIILRSGVFFAAAGALMIIALNPLL